MDKADKAWLSDVGAGKVATAADGSDALSLPQSDAPAPVPIEAAPGRGDDRPRRHRERP
jgi:hypothetical protein